MIEVIYNENGQAKEESSTYVKIPKNIRQIGEIHNKKKIYVEDYVITYLRQLTQKEDSIPQAAVLLGEAKRSEGVQYIFARGAVETNKIEVDNEGIHFTDDAWTDIYEKVKNFFDELEIVGWMLIVPGLSYAVNGDIVKTHIRNFAGNDKIFMMFETSEQEESFYLFENGELVRQKGYYIYFEKNPEMQDYMIYKNENVSIEEKEENDDKVTQNFRTIVQEKKEETHHKRMMAFMYGASTFLVMIVVVIGVTMINNYDKMKNMEESLQVISSTVGGNEEGEAENNIPKTNSSEVPVVDIPANIEPQEGTDDGKAEEDGEKGAGEGTPADDAGENNPPAETPVSSQIPESYIVAKGDTLASISKKFYGDNSMVAKICEVNQIENGDKILIGQKLMLP